MSVNAVFESTTETDFRFDVKLRTFWEINGSFVYLDDFSRFDSWT